MLSCVRVIECESLKLKFIILNNSSWASCASVDRMFVRMNGNIKRLVLHFRFINLLHRIFNFTASCWGKLSYKFSSFLDLLLVGEKFIN